jgi:hypothetical protein
LAFYDDDMNELGFDEAVVTRNPGEGIVTVGGFYADRVGFPAGIFAGKPARATRDRAVPLVTLEELARWASEQADLLAHTSYAPEVLVNCVDLVRACGGDTGNLPIAKSANGWLTKHDIAAWQGIPEELALTSPNGIPAGGGSPYKKYKMHHLKLNPKRLRQ